MTTTPRTERPDMADYGVPDDLEGVLPWSWAEERLLASRNLWVVTASPSGRPHAMPVWGAWVPSTSTFFFSCSPNSRRARNLVANPRVTVAVDDTVEVVSVEGTARVVERGEAEHALAVYLPKYYEPDARDGAREFVESHQMFEVDPERAFGIIETEEDFSRRATRWVW
jgi:hypothetical protein